MTGRLYPRIYRAALQPTGVKDGALVSPGCLCGEVAVTVLVAPDGESYIVEWHQEWRCIRHA